MPIAIISTGTELLKGCCCNTNSAFAGNLLTRHGLPPVLEISAGDRSGELFFAVSTALKKADILIISGGLGPTSDDITLETAARFFNLDLIIEPVLQKKVESFWTLRHGKSHCPKSQYKQAQIPSGGEYFDNPCGVASGIGFHTLYDGKQRHIFLLPGPPAEFENVFSEKILDEILKISEQKKYTSSFMICNTGEAIVARKAEPMLKAFPIEIAYTAIPGGTKLFLSGSDRSVVETAIAKAHDLFPDNALPINCPSAAKYIIDTLKSSDSTLGCAESCTGGLVANELVAIPGASAVFKGSITAYANEIKQNLLSVPESILAEFGAVSKECAEAMALGACKSLNCDCSISTTGIAGPDGGTPEKPVGLVFVGAAYKGVCAVRQLNLRGNRRMIRERAVAGALNLLIDLLKSPEKESLC